MRILSANANRPLAEAISHYLDVRLTQAEVRRFNDKEIYVEIQETRPHRGRFLESQRRFLCH